MGENGTSDSLPTSTSSKKKGPQIILPSLPRSIYKPQIPLSPLLTSTLKMPIKKNEEEKQEEEEEDFQLAYITEDDSTFACKALNNTDEFNLKVNSKDENKEQLVLQVNLQTMQSKFKHPRGQKSNDNNHVKNEEQLVLQIKNSAPSTSKVDNLNLQTIQSNLKRPRGKKSNDNNHVKNEEFEKQVSHSLKNSCFLQSRRGGEKKPSQKRKINIETCNNQQKVDNKKRIKKEEISYYYKCEFCKKEVLDLKAHTDSRHASQFFKNDDANKDVNNAAKKYPKKKQAKEESFFSSDERTDQIIPVRLGPKNDEDANNVVDNAAKESPKKKQAKEESFFSNKCRFCNKKVDDLKAHEDSTHPKVTLEDDESMFSSDDDSFTATYQKSDNSNDSDDDGWTEYVKEIKKERRKNKIRQKLYNDKEENENNKHEEMQSTPSELLEKNNQSKRFEDTKNDTENDTGSEDDIPDFDDDDDW